MPAARHTFRVDLAQIAPSLGDLERNRDLHLERVAAAAEAGSDLIVFPELSLTGYWLHDMVSEVALDPAGAPLLEPLRQASSRIDVVLGLVEAGEDGQAYNTAVWLSGGKVLARHRKVHLPTYGMFDEGRYFAPGSSVRAFDTRLGRAGLLVCEDLWHTALPWLLARDGADLLVVLSSSPGRGPQDGDLRSQHAWHVLAETAARFQTQFVVFVGRVGVEDGHTFGGGSFVYGPDGRRLAGAPLLDEAAVTVTLDRRELRAARAVTPLRRDERPDLVRRELDRILAVRERREGRRTPPTK